MQAQKKCMSVLHVCSLCFKSFLTVIVQLYKSSVKEQRVGHGIVIK